MRVATKVAVGAAAAAAARRRFRNWGSTSEERVRRLPGDELVPEPATTVTLATTVDASSEEVWRWLGMLLGIRSRAERGAAPTGARCNPSQPPPAADEALAA